MKAPLVVTFALAAWLMAAPPVVPAQGTAEHATVVHPTVLHISPDTNSANLGDVERGRDLAIVAKSHDWVQVFASMGQERDVTGWVEARYVVGQNTPNADQIVFGEAVDSEAEASRRGGRKGAANDAGRLYYWIYDNMLKSPLAGEALYRAADIKWQMEKQDVSTLPSAKEMDPWARPQLNDELMRLVEKKFPRTKWSDLAAFALIDNKLCGEWQAKAKCPEKESEIYEKYAAEHPQSPKAAEALFEAAWRQAALVDIYRTDEDAGKSNSAKSKAIALAQRVTSQYGQTDWAARAADLVFKLNQGVAVFGNDAQ